MIKAIDTRHYDKSTNREQLGPQKQQISILTRTNE